MLSLGGSLKIKMADGGIQRSTFIVKHDGSIDFLIKQKISVQEPGKFCLKHFINIFVRKVNFLDWSFMESKSRREKTKVPARRFFD